MAALGRLAAEAWHLWQDAALYVLFGLLVAGLLKVFLSTEFVASHLGRGRVRSVIKAALLGIPLPLCSCGVLPAAAALKRQGASNGATTAFLIATPESGVDSITVSWALLDPLMTVARPVVALATAVVAGVTENLLGPPPAPPVSRPAPCPVDGCCDGQDCPPASHRRHHPLGERLVAGLRFALHDLWAELVGWYLVGILLAALLTVLVPEELMTRALGGGLVSMLLMLALGVPIYICATASTPLAAAMILKGASPGAALVFLLAGPATNLAALAVLVGLIGRRSTAIYLAAIALVSVAGGLTLDALYGWLAISPQAMIGQAGELVPQVWRLAAALLLAAISLRPLAGIGRGLWRRAPGRTPAPAGCGCGGPCATTPQPIPLASLNEKPTASQKKNL
ncbi:MAG: SO_0444 family Cu/Zn efflux transporter [Thermodesulfobacteriota bacterium]